MFNDRIKFMTHRILLFIILLHFTAIIYAEQHSAGDWFPFTPENTFESGVTGMADWLDAPAGKHGFLRMQNNDLVFEDGTPIKLWGTNICSSRPFVNRAKVDSFAHFLSRFGVNAVRFHKFTRHAYDGNHSTRLDPEKFKRLDDFHARLREKGIYIGWSHIYGHKVLPGDSSRVLAYEEIKNLSYPWPHLNGTTSALVNFAPDLQDLNISLTVNMLEHVNPHTGLRYAKDPALAFVEFQNEDNIFWSAIEKSLDQAPTYRSLLCRLFSEWLQGKYGSQEALERAWGEENLPEDQTLAAKNIYPQPNHGLFSHEYETAQKENRPMARHILDKMRFLYETQMDYYKKFERAVRGTGYKGVLVSSCWQAGSGISHFYNLHADYRIGMIDRHNYFGGGAGRHHLSTGAVKNTPMLAEPGSGLLSTGMQQVVDRPFSFSEWMSLIPNQWTAEAAPIIALYGMGLQGWDASFSFATDIPRYSRYLESESHGVYNATSPLHMGLYPALARMVYRGDVEQSPVLATRNVHVPSLSEGTLGFQEWVEQGFDDKRFSGTFSAQALAIGRVPVKFTDSFEPTKVPDFTDCIDSPSKVITSATGELRWRHSEPNVITVNTPATKGIIGFAPDEKIELGSWTISTTNRFAVILVTSLSQDQNLAKADDILITTVARARNTGMVYNAAGDTLLATGDKPLRLEPVNATIKSPRLTGAKINVLNHDGLRTNRFVQIKDNAVHLDGAENKALYYLLERE